MKDIGKFISKMMAEMSRDAMVVNSAGGSTVIQSGNSTIINGIVVGDQTGDGTFEAKLGDLEITGRKSIEIGEDGTVKVDGLHSGQVRPSGSLTLEITKGCVGSIKVSGSVTATTINGDVEAGRDVKASTVNGDVKASGSVQVDKTVNGDVEARGSVIVNGRVNGDVTMSNLK